MTRLLSVLLLLLLLTSCGTSGRAAPAAPPSMAGRSTHSVVVSGASRSYVLYVPGRHPQHAPLVVVLHGGFGSAEQAEQAYGWDAEADQGGFLVLYPQGAGRAWDVGAGCCGTPGKEGVDDVAAVSAMVADVEKQVPVDVSRRFATGMSNGALMSYRLACDTRLFAAIGPVAGTQLGTCPAPAPTSVLHIHGLDDHNIPFDGSPGTGVASVDGPPVPAVIAGWRAVDSCATPAVTVAGVVTTSLSECADGRAVELITVAGAGHQWPGAKSREQIPGATRADQPSTALDATAVLWAFFAAHPAR